MSELHEPKDQEVEYLDDPEAGTPPVANTPTEESAPADVFEHLANIRSGISDGVITPW